MTPEERRLALEVLGEAWQRLPAGAQGAHLLACVEAAASELPARHAFVSADYARHAGEAAVWYLDRATRRLGDPDRDGFTPQQRADNLGRFAARARPEDLERLFAVASALDADDA
jgi:hypothetical protein